MADSHPHQILHLLTLCHLVSQFSRSVVSDPLSPHGLQHTRLPCPSPTPRACSNSFPLNWGCHQSSHPLSSPFPPAVNLSQHQGLFQWVSSSHQVVQSIGVSASALVLPMNIQDWFLLRLTGLSLHNTISNILFTSVLNRWISTLWWVYEFLNLNNKTHNKVTFENVCPSEIYTT